MQSIEQEVRQKADKVEKMVAWGLTNEQIADLLDINKKTLVKYHNKLITATRATLVTATVSPKRGKTVQRLAAQGESMSGVARILGLSRDICKEQYQGDYDVGRLSLKKLIHKHQLLILEEGNAAMAIHLGKTVLGQRDKKEITHKRETLEHVSISFVKPGDTSGEQTLLKDVIEHDPRFDEKQITFLDRAEDE